MSDDMTLQTLLQMRADLEKNIENLVADFEAATGVEVRDLDVRRLPVQEIGKWPRSMLEHIETTLSL